jgi:Carboxypeptidase regulatory-like domain
MSKMKFVFSMVLMFAFAGISLAQTSKGTVVGTVLDPNGAVVAGATVKLTNTETGVSREVTTTAEGTYRFEAVDPGSYKIDVTAAGFKATSIQNVISAGGQTSDYPATLAVGNPAEIVEVTSETVILQTQDGTRVNTLDTRQITELPVGGLNPVNLVFTLPGVTDPGPKAGGFVQGTEFNVNGIRARGNNQLLDGLDNNDNSIAGQNYQPVLRDGYNEVTVLQSDYSAEYGRAGGAVVNVITRGGTNEFHGSAYDVLNNSFFNSRTPRQRSAGVKRPVVVENTFGGSLGGPIKKNKLFFFGTFQPDLLRSTTTANGVVPTTAGFTTLRTLFPAGASANLDAYLTALGAARGATNTFTLPLGNGRPDVEFGTATISAPQPVTDYQGLGRVDWTPNAKDAYSFRYVFDKQRFSNQFPSVFPGYEIDVPSLTQNAFVNWTRTISSTLTNEFRFGAVRTNVIFAPRNSALLTAGPLVVFGSSPLDNFNLDPTFPQGRIFNNFQFQDTVSWSRGNHTFRIGADLLKQKAKEIVPFGDRGTLVFTQDENGDFSDFANFIDQFSGVEGQFASKVFGSPVVYPEPFYQNYFINDTWRVRPNLTLNLGLRYENSGAPYNVIPFPTFAGFDQPIDTRVEQKRDNNNFAPRVSFAYTPHFFKKIFGEDRTVIRGGFAVNYDFFFSNILENTASGVPNANGVATFGGDVGGRGFANSTLANSLPSTLVGPPDPFAGVVSIEPGLRNPETYVWNLGIQRQLPWHVIADIAYVGSRGLHQFLNIEENPRIGPLTGISNDVRVHPGFGSVLLRTNSGDSNYHSLQTRLERGFGNGLFFRTAYTFSKAIDTVNSEVFTTTGASTRQTDPFGLHGGLRADRSVASYDVPHRFVASVLYALPSPIKHGFAKELMSGFQLSGIFRIQSGNVETPFVNGVDLNRDGSAANDRPAISNPQAPSNSVAFRSTLFGIPGAGYVDINGNPITLSNARYVVDRAFQTGIAGRNTLRAPAINSLDLSLQRSFSVPKMENAHFEVRFDVFNALNHPQFAFTNGDVSDGNVLNEFFNQPRLNRGGSTRDANRIGRVQLRFVF